MANIYVMENHDQAYYRWRDAGVRNKILVHIDAHHDMWWRPDDRPITIANFVCAALKDNLVREVVWVVPDPSWHTSASRKTILRHLKKISKSYPGQAAAIKIERDEMSTQVLGRALRACPLARLPRVDEPVLLDIDVDFFVIPRVAYAQGDTHAAVPWCWPDRLVARLRQDQMRTEIATITYSTEGGYTPLKWRYLGEELALRLDQNPERHPALQGLALLREASLAASRNERPTAERLYREAIAVVPTSPAARYHLAELYLDIGRIDDGRALYQQAVALDRSYRTACGSAGLLYQADGRVALIEGLLGRMLTLDPEDAYAQLGLGILAYQRKQWDEAERRLKQALVSDGPLVDANRALGDLLARQGRDEEAIRAYEQSLKLVLRGGKVLRGAILTADPKHRPVLDPAHARIHARVGRLYARSGSSRRAIDAYRISIAAGHDGVVLRCRLARLYWTQRHRRQAVRESWAAVQMSPVQVWKVSRDLLWRLRRWVRTAI